MNLIFCVGNRAFKSEVIILEVIATETGGDEFDVAESLWSSKLMSLVLAVFSSLSSADDDANNLDGGGPPPK